MSRGEFHLSLTNTMILMVVFLLMIGIFMYSAKAFFSSTGEDVSCITQIKTHRTIASITNEYTLTGITCPTKHIALADPSQERAKQVVADEMVRCARMWERGNATLFKDDEGVFCHICSMIEISPEMEIEGFPQYLVENDHIDFLTGVRKGHYFDDQEFRDHALDRMETGDSLAVIFYYWKGQTFMERMAKNTFGDPVFGLVAGTLVLGTAAAALPVTGAVGALVTATGAAAGGSIGGIASLLVRPESSTAAAVHVRPLTTDAIDEIGCVYAPVRES